MSNRLHCLDMTVGKLDCGKNGRTVVEAKGVGETCNSNFQLPTPEATQTGYRGHTYSLGGQLNNSNTDYNNYYSYYNYYNVRKHL